MSNLTRWDRLTGDSFKALDLVQSRLSKLLSEIDGVFDRNLQLGKYLNPRADITEDKENLYYMMELPGVDVSDVKITLSEGTLMVHGVKRREERKADEKYHSYERSFGEFTRTFSVPDGVNADAIRADFDNGVLQVKIPLPTAAVPAKEIKVMTGGKKQGALKTNGHQSVVT